MQSCKLVLQTYAGFILQNENHLHSIHLSSTVSVVHRYKTETETSDNARMSSSNFMPIPSKCETNTNTHIEFKFNYCVHCNYRDILNALQSIWNCLIKSQ